MLLCCVGAGCRDRATRRWSSVQPAEEKLRLRRLPRSPPTRLVRDLHSDHHHRQRPYSSQSPRLATADRSHRLSSAPGPRSSSPTCRLASVRHPPGPLTRARRCRPTAHASATHTSKGRFSSSSRLCEHGGDSSSRADIAALSHPAPFATLDTSSQGCSPRITRPKPGRVGSFAVASSQRGYHL